MLKVNGISVAYDKTQVVKQVTFALKSGELGAIVGPSGSGKSSLLRAIAGFEPVVAGSVELNGVDVATVENFVPPEHRSIGFVFQDYALFPYLTVSQNIAFGLNKLTAANRAERVAELLTLTDLQGFAERYPQQLSGGQQQRVALARALAPEPKLLLLDEPFASLDLALRERMKKDLGTLLRRVGVTSLLVTHNLDEAFDLADEMGVMLDGTLSQWDQPQILYDAPHDRGVATYLGSVSFLPILSCEGSKCQTELGPIPHAIERCEAGKLVALRPENICLSDSGNVNSLVTDVWFRGAFYLCELLLDSGSKVLAAQSRTTAPQFRVGDRLKAAVTGACRVAIDGPYRAS